MFTLYGSILQIKEDSVFKVYIGGNPYDGPYQGTGTGYADSGDGNGDPNAMPVATITLKAGGYEVDTAVLTEPQYSSDPADYAQRLAIWSPKKDLPATPSQHGERVYIAPSPGTKGFDIVWAGLVADMDTTPPTITAPNVTIDEGDNFDPMSGVSANDNKDGDITGKVTHTGYVDTLTPGDYTITYEVSDSSGNKATKTRIVTVRKVPGTTIACAPQTGDPAAAVWQASSILVSIVCLGLAGVVVSQKRKAYRRI